MRDVSNLSLEALLDQLGVVKDKMSTLKEQEAYLKEALVSRMEAADLVDASAKRFRAELTYQERTALNQSAVRDEMGDDWWADHCKTTEVRTLRIKRLNP